MATKTSKKTTVISSSASSSSQSATPLPPRPSSPLSPTRYSRLQEKADLQNFYDRLACYIDRVRQLESENSKLTREVQTTQETITRETTQLKSMYENELSDARRLLDDTSRERARLEIDCRRLSDENAELRLNLDKKTKDLVSAEKSLTIYESRVNDLSNKYNQAAGERKKLLDQIKELEKEVEKLRKQLNDTRKQLEEETLARVDLENNVQPLKEELNFKEQIHQQQLTETRTRRQVEISEIDGRLTQEYEAKLQQSLKDLREQYEATMRVNREEIETLYENKIRDLQSQAQKNTGAATLAVEELGTFDGLTARVSELETANASLQCAIFEVKQSCGTPVSRPTPVRGGKRKRILLEEFEESYYSIQSDNSISSQAKGSVEISENCPQGKFVKLHNKGNKCAIFEVKQSCGTPVSRPTPVRGGKRKRILLEEFEESYYSIQSDNSISSQAKGSVEISENCPQGKFVKLHNKGNKCAIFEVKQSCGTPVSRPTPVRGGKRKRILLEEFEESYYSIQSDYSISSQAKGSVEISENCPQGKFVKLHNKGNKCAIFEVKQSCGTPVSRPTPVRGGKRKRILLEEFEESYYSIQSDNSISSQAKGSVEISENCPQGKFVKLHNKGNKEVSLGGWQLVRKAGDTEVTYKFHHSVNIDAGGTVTVWSSDAGQSHEPPRNLVMKGQKWFFADNMSTSLVSSSGDELAICEQTKVQLSSASARHHEMSGYLSSDMSLGGGAEDLFHQQGDPRGDDRCRIM